MAQEDRTSLISRVGTFFVLMGVFGVILFVVSDVTKNTNFVYFIMAIILLVIGWILKIKSPTPPLPDKRFDGIRKIQQSRRETKAKNEKNKKK